MADMVFEDAKGRKWNLEIVVTTLKRMRLVANFSLDEIFTLSDLPPTTSVEEIERVSQERIQKYQAFLNDAIRFSEVIYAIAKPQVDAANLTQNDFDEGLDQNAIQRAMFAFHEAFTNFSSPPQSTILRGVKMQMEKLKTLNYMGAKRIEKEMKKQAAKFDDDVLEKLVNDGIDDQLKKHAGNLAVVSPLTQASTPTAN